MCLSLWCDFNGYEMHTGTGFNFAGTNFAFTYWNLVRFSGSHFYVASVFFVVVCKCLERPLLRHV